MLQQIWEFLMKPLLASIKSSSTIIIINGQTYVGDAVAMSDDGNTITISGVSNQTLNIRNMPNIDIVIHGDVDTLEMSQGNVTCNDVHGNAKTGQGDIDCRDVTGNVRSSQGNIKANNVGGDVKTSMGNIKYRK